MSRSGRGSCAACEARGEGRSAGRLRGCTRYARRPLRRAPRLVRARQPLPAILRLGRACVLGGSGPCVEANANPRPNRATDPALLGCAGVYTAAHGPPWHHRPKGRLPQARLHWWERGLACDTAVRCTRRAALGAAGVSGGGWKRDTRLWQRTCHDCQQCGSTPVRQIAVAAPQCARSLYLDTHRQLASCMPTACTLAALHQPVHTAPLDRTLRRALRVPQRPAGADVTRPVPRPGVLRPGG
jgi:hypothetical protein